jgi:hypothetical protein
VKVYEEPTLAKTFGDQYERYRPRDGGRGFGRGAADRRAWQPPPSTYERPVRPIGPDESAARPSSSREE